MGNILEIESKHLGEQLVRNKRVEVRSLNDEKFGGHVAAKISLGGDDLNGEVKKEYKLLKKNPHKHIVHAFEYCKIKGENRIGYFMEFLGGGSLKEVIFCNTYTLNEAVQWTSQIASALEFLHLRDIVHGNLTPEKIFLDCSQMNAKLSGFIPFERLDKHDSRRIEAFAYSAPEVLAVAQLNRAGTVQTGSDVYSLAVIFWHLATRDFPYDYDLNVHEFLTSVVDHGLRPSPMSKHPDNVNQFLQKCFDAHPSVRPTMKEFHSNVQLWTLYE